MNDYFLKTGCVEMLILDDKFDDDALRKISKINTLDLGKNTIITDYGVSHLVDFNKLLLGFNTKITGNGLR